MTMTTDPRALVERLEDWFPPGNVFTEAWHDEHRTDCVEAAATITRLTEEVEGLRGARRLAVRTATDRQYMIDHLVQMLGPKGREVWALWQSKGVQRIHVSWGPGVVGKEGEEIAQLHLDIEKACEGAEPIDDIDAEIAARAQLDREGGRG